GEMRGGVLRAEEPAGEADRVLEARGQIAAERRRHANQLGRAPPARTSGSSVPPSAGAGASTGNSTGMLRSAASTATLAAAVKVMSSAQLMLKTLTSPSMPFGRTWKGSTSAPTTRKPATH